MVFKALSILLFLLLSADAAYAGPVGAAVAAIGSFFATGIGSMVARVAVGFGFSLLQKALTGKNKTAAVGQVLEIKMGEDQPMSFIIGSRAVGGRRKYIGTWGSDGKTPNAYLTDVIELSNLPSYAGAQGLNSLWIDDKKCTVDWASPHADGRGYPIKEFRKSGKDYLWIKYYDGTQTAADSFLVAKFGGNADRPYGSDRIGLGVQYVILTARYNSDLFSGMPTGIYEPKPTPFYDPRKDSTNGGSGAHRWGNPATYEPTLNPITAAYNIVRGIYYGGDWFYGGQNISAHRLPNASWFAAANECDRVINGVAQFRCGLEVTLDTEPLDALEDLRVACAGRFAEVGGFIKPLVGAPGSAVYSFDDGGIVVTKDQDFEPFPSLKTTHNRVTGTYPEPAEKWATKDAPENRNLTLEAEDGNRSLPVSVAFTAVPYSEQVQALIKTMVQEQRRFRTHVVTLPPSAAALEPNDVVAWTSERNAYSNKKFLVTANNGQAGMLRQVSLTEIDPSDYDPPDIIVAPVIGWTGPVLAPIQAATGFQATAGSVTDANSLQRRPAIVVSCDADLDDVARVWVQIRVKSTGVIVLDSDANPYAAPATWTMSGSWCLAVTEYEVRGKLVPVTSRETEWSAWISVTTLNLSESSDVLDGSITTQKLAEAAVTASKIMDEAVTNLKLANQSVGTSKLQVEAVTQEILAAKSVIADKLADAAVTGAKLAAQAVDATKFAASIEPVTVVSALPTNRVTAYVSYGGQSYRWNGAAYVKTVATSELTGQLIGSQIADLAIVASKIADGIITGSKIAADTITGNNLAVGSVTAKSLAVTDYTNLIPNGNFNTDDLASLYDLNTAAGKGAIYFAGGINVNGNRGLVLQKVTTPYNTYDLSILLKTANAIPVEGGATYGWGIQYYTNSGTTSAGGVYFRLRWLDANKTELSNQDPVSNAIIAAARSKYAGQVVAPAAARFVTVQIYSNANNANTTNLLVDYMYLQKANAAQLIVDGSILANMISSGAVTTDKLLANAVTTAKIAAGAVSADQIAASAVIASKIAAGAITADKLAVGVSANQLTNSDASAGTTGWGIYYANGGVYGLNKRTDGYAPANGSSFELSGNVTNAQYADMGPINPLTGGPKSFAVSAGSYYEFSGRYYAQGCRAVTFYIEWINAAGTTLGYSGQQYDASNMGGNPNYDFTRYFQGYVKGQAPANAVAARVFFRCEGSSLASGSGNTYAWVTQLFFGVATVSQTSATVWSDGGTTLIQNGNIITGTITGDRLVVGTLTATQIAAGAITTPAIAAGAVTGNSIAASTITGVNIAASTIGADKLAVNSVTAKSIVITDFTNLVPDNQMQDPVNSWPGAGWSSWTDPYLGGMASLSQMRFPYVAGATGYGGELLGTRFPVQGGQQYRVTGSAYGNSVISPLLRIKWLDRSGALISYIDYLSGDQSAGIKTATVNLTAPSNAAYAQMAAYVWRTTTTNDVYVGGFVVNKRNAADLIVDGSITANKLAVNSLSALSANLGTVTAGIAQSSDGKLVINFNAGSLEWYE